MTEGITAINEQVTKESVFIEELLSEIRKVIVAAGHRKRRSAAWTNSGSIRRSTPALGPRTRVLRLRRRYTRDTWGHPASLRCAGYHAAPCGSGT